MRFAPYERLTIRTSLTAEEARKRLAAVIEPRRWVRLSPRDHLPYEGRLDADRFAVKPIILYRNSFLPVIRGHIRPDPRGTVIEITMVPNAFAILFMFLWFNILFDFITPGLKPLFQSTEPRLRTLVALLIPGGLMAFGYALLMIGFKRESVPSKAFFDDLFTDDPRRDDGDRLQRHVAVE